MGEILLNSPIVWEPFLGRTSLNNWRTLIQEKRKFVANSRINPASDVEVFQECSRRLWEATFSKTRWTGQDFGSRFGTSFVKKSTKCHSKRRSRIKTTFKYTLAGEGRKSIEKGYQKTQTQVPILGAKIINNVKHTIWKIIQKSMTEKHEKWCQNDAKREPEIIDCSSGLRKGCSQQLLVLPQ